MTPIWHQSDTCLTWEGFEALALRGSMQLFQKRTVAFVFTEFSPSNMISVTKDP